MLVSDYDSFVKATDRSIDKSVKERLEIAIYGLVGEIGSVVAAVKKRILAEDSAALWNEPNEEIIEELGDVLWYGFCLARAANEGKPINIFAHDIANLRREIGANNLRAERIAKALDPSKREAFLRAAAEFPRTTKVMTFEDYQKVAFLTARTENRVLTEVCLAVLWQLSAQLFRQMLPEVERDLNQSMVDRPINDLLGEIAWHVAALSSIYQLAMSDIARKNVEKVSFRLDRKNPTPLHDRTFHEDQQFPRRFEEAFVTVAKGRSRMYMKGQQLGDELTDNAHDDDGYRCHDVMHLANAAKLGWSPVLRALMDRKRKGDPRIDEVEDGARARIVEEAVIKAIHSEGHRQAALRGPVSSAASLFRYPEEISFKFLSFVRKLVEGLESEANRYWEWEEAILSGHEIFGKLRMEGQGTVVVDLAARSIAFVPEVCLELTGAVAGLGSAYVDDSILEATRDVHGVISCPGGSMIREQIAQKMAVLDAIGFKSPTAEQMRDLTITAVPNRGISVKAVGDVQDAIWARKAIAFRTSAATTPSGGCYCTAIAIA